jgi:hypothetical protein
VSRRNKAKPHVERAGGEIAWAGKIRIEWRLGRKGTWRREPGWSLNRACCPEARSSAISLDRLTLEGV